MPLFVYMIHVTDEQKRCTADHQTTCTTRATSYHPEAQGG